MRKSRGDHFSASGAGNDTLLWTVAWWRLDMGAGDTAPPCKTSADQPSHHHRWRPGRRLSFVNTTVDVRPAGQSELVIMVFAVTMNADHPGRFRHQHGC
jgi:hypothetical protein